MLPYLLIWEALYQLKKFMCVLCDIFPSNLFFYNWCSDIFNDNFLIKQLGTYLWAELKYKIKTFHSLTRDVSVHCPLMMFTFSELLIISAICKTTIRSQYLLKYFHVSNTIVSVDRTEVKVIEFLLSSISRVDYMEREAIWAVRAISELLKKSMLTFSFLMVRH